MRQLTNEEYRSTAAGAVGGYLQLEERVNAALHRNEHGEAEPNLVLVDQRHPAQNDAVSLQPLDTLPARCR